uniref:Uncharacterized protein n=1 Tax=Panagrolaimus sp. ES5 TaxID=591445 RepID=A0AC34FXZ4_9BILA
MKRMVDFVVVIFVIFCGIIFQNGSAAPATFSTSTTTKITWDCHLYAWRDGFAPAMKDIGLNGTEKLILHDSKTNSDKFSSFIRSHGLTKRCRPDNGTIVFMDRQEQQIPQLIVMVRYYSETFYSLIRLNIEELLASKSFVSQSLLGQFDESSIPVYTGTENPKSCTFVKKALHCFSLINDHVIKQTIYKLGKSEGKIVYGEYSSKNHSLSMLRIIEPVMAATWDGKNNDSSVYVYDEISDGWLYKLNGDETTAGGIRKQSMHKFPTTNKMLKNLWAIDKQLLIVSKCSELQCQYFWVQLHPESHSPFTCLFTSPINVITGVLTDIRLQPLIPELPEQQALSAGWILPDSKNSFWLLIILVSICLLIVLIILVIAFIYETIGFKRKNLIGKGSDEQYSNVFWKENDEEIACTISDSNFNELPPNPPAEKKKLPTEEENLSLLTPAVAPELPKSPVKSRHLFVDDENKTPESIKPEKRKSTKSKSAKKPEIPSKNEMGPYKEIKMSTHKPRALNPKKKGNRRTRRTPTIPDPDADKKSEKQLPKENKDDVMESIKVKTNLTKFEPLASGEFTTDTIKSKNEKENGRKRKSKSKSTKK